jgi:MFS transporter, OFA family, oxalate/formate antiporter
MSRQLAPQILIPRLPFFYGWVVLACVCCAGFSRQGSAVATLSVFVTPMTSEFGWSRTLLSGAVSLGGVLAAIASPMLGSLLDRYGARAMLCAAVAATGIANLLLSQIDTVLAFYLLFCIARMNFAGPFELGIYGAVNNWFVARRPQATSIATLAQMGGLVAMPLIAQAAMLGHGWRGGWLAIGVCVLAVGFLPSWFLMVRRPEDVGLVPDRRVEPTAGAAPALEPAFSRRQAMRTPAFWLLALYTALVFPVQAGVSLHQAAHLIERHIDPAVAATIVATFSGMSALASLGVGFIPRGFPVRFALAALGGSFGLGALLMIGIDSALHGFLAAGLFGFGIGGVLTVLPIAWADYFGRRSYGAIRGVALTVQVLAQAAGPLLSGVLRDWTGDYVLSLECFAVLSCLSLAVALLTRPPQPPAA